ncbi:flagellar biosynthetic protein FliR [Hyphomonas sp.]|uniref:flagellar biosynthetic protein FliR n=1 Tax=Hyphomonas sp. TaxID=87 RepID=UPI0025C5B201|nr:flagellar biosynthetic protein FliR [Hyphomonas sp.]
MDLIAPYLGQASPWMVLFMTVIARLSFVVFMMPGIGDQVISARVRLFVLLGIAAAIASTGVVPVPSADKPAELLLLLGSEVVIGFGLGALLRLSVWMLTIAGSVIAQSIGLAQFLGVALEHEAQTVTSNMLSLAGTTVLLTANYHVAVVDGLMRLYTEIPLGQLAQVSWPMIFSSFYSALSFALMLAWPFVAANLLYNICLGFINKALPSLMVAFVGAPFMVGAGVMLLAISIAGMLIIWKDRALQVIGWL